MFDSVEAARPSSDNEARPVYTNGAALEGVAVAPLA